MSKRKLRVLVEQGHVSGWDDPRLPSLRGLRRRGYTPKAIRECLRRVGMAKFPGTTDIALLEHCLRQDLNKTSPRVMAVLRPLKVVLPTILKDKPSSSKLSITLKPPKLAVGMCRFLARFT